MNSSKDRKTSLPPANNFQSTVSTQFGEINQCNLVSFFFQLFQEQQQKLNKNELNSLLSYFNQLDRNDNGYITIDNVKQMIQAIYQKEINISIYLPNLLLNDQKHFTFDDILMLITDIDFYLMLTEKVKQSNIPTKKGCELLLIQLEIACHEQRRNDYLNNPIIADFLKILRTYQRNSERNTNYVEAQLANEKIQHIKLKQKKRWQHYLNTMEKYQVKKLDEVVDENFKKFTSEWDQYTQEYRANAFNTLKELKKKQNQQIRQIENDIRMQSKLKLSKQLLQLRNKQKNLAKIKKYELAELIRVQADEIELCEKQKMEEELQKIVDKKIKMVRKLQQQQVTAFLLKVQKERNDHLLQRKNDSERLGFIRKNQQSDIESKYGKEKNLNISTRLSFNKYRLPQSASVTTRANVDGRTKQYLNFTQNEIISSEFSQQNFFKG